MTRYELLDRIGVGGMAEIFRGKAVAAGGFEKPVAIKRIRPHLSQDRRFVELLIAEAKVLSLLKHRNIVQIFDVGLGDDGKYFLVMEFVDGKDLGAVQRVLEQQRRRMPFDLVLHVGAEICEALEHAHTARAPDGREMSLVHRDVSPSNVLVSRAGEVKLTDFGIAKRAEQDVTHGGAVRGKFAYISPEQARNEHLDPRGDVFSVGILLWELVTNRRLFSQLDDLAALRAVREANIPRPSEIDPRLPPELDALLMAALARDKQRRYGSAGAFGAKLRSLRYSLEVTTGDPAAELARLVDSTEEIERASARSIQRTPTGAHDFDPQGEATVIRIRTADAFSARDNDASIVKAREVIDRFEEEETRLAQLSGDQLRMLRANAPRDSSEMTAAAPPISTSRARRESEERTRARAPLSEDELRAVGSEEETRLVAPRDPHSASLRDAARSGEAGTFARRTPVPQRIGRPPSAPPPIPPPVPLPPPPPFQPDPAMPIPASGGASLPFAMPPASGWAPPIAAQHPPRDATPTTHDTFDRPMYSGQPAQRPSVPQVAGFGPSARKSPLRPWMLVVGALVMAALAFALTRLFIRG